MEKRGHRKQNIVLSAIFALSAVLNILAWNSTAFSDLHTKRVFPLWVRLYGGLTSRVPFSVGEWMLGAAVIWIALAVVLAVVLLFLRRKRSFRKFAEGFFRLTAWITAVVVLIMTQNCFIQYHCTPIEKGLPGYGRDYSLEDLTKLRNMVVRRCNALSAQMERDENGELVYSPGQDAMKEEAGRCMRQLSENGWPQLGGFQVMPKALRASVFMSQQKMQGYYFPFSMEANFNDIMEISNKPYTMCHELSHTHGYIYEDDANFLAFLACTQSEDIFFQYSGWLGVLNYVDNDFWYSAGREYYFSQIHVLPRVRKDNQFLSEEVEAWIEKEAVLDSEVVEKAADTYVDTTLKVNGVKAGKLSYSNVVSLLLKYYAEPED